ncbi:hypothetical protein J4447_00695 [Candidatus Pacearchaeota archaeon]|nr:hypothetical protein [Candidatus Pacearchaeota archaeon]
MFISQYKHDKRGQVTLFIIIALVIIAMIALLAYFWNDIKSITVETTPQSFIESCMNTPIDSAVNDVFLHGGTAAQKNFINYNGEKIEYLCYTNEYYKTCVVQQPLLKQSIERELNSLLKSQAKVCIDSLKEDMTSKGYSVNSDNRVDFITNLSLDKADFIISTPIVFTKGDASQSFSHFTISRRSKLYELIMSAVYILNWEARYGDFDILTFMFSYPDLRLEKLKQSEGSKIYILSSRSTNEKFIFASRSISWPPGFAVNERVGE